MKGKSSRQRRAPARATAARRIDRFAPGLEALTVPLADVKIDPRNARAHSDRNLEAIRASLRRFGQQKPIVIDATLTTVAGAGTVLAMRAEGWTRVAAVRTDLTDERERRAYAIADNRTAELAEWDRDELAEQLADFLSEGDTDGLGFDRDEIGKLLAQPEQATVESVDVSKVADEFWVSVRGPLPRQPDALERLRAALEQIPDVEVHVGTTKYDDDGLGL